MPTARVTADSLHVRRTPKLGDNIVGYLHLGDVVELGARSADGNFVKIRHDALTGYASTKWLKAITSASSYVVTAAVSLFVRQEPSPTAAKVGHLAHGDVVKVDRTSPDGKWRHVTKGSLKGWASARYLRVQTPSGPTPAPPAKGAPRWYAIAEAELGRTRKPGTAHNNPRILQYLRSTNLGKPANEHDETFWCSAFANWCVEQSGKDGTNSARARDWLGWGRPITTPTKGCIVVFWRGSKSGTKGHVGFYAGSAGPGKIKVLGGNQGNSVSIATHDTSRLLGYRTL